MSDGWCTIESDPAVFTEMIANLGVTGVAVEELVALDPESLATVGDPLYGLVLLFKWNKQTEERNIQKDAVNIYFAQQTVQNACATQAIINILLNHKEAVDLGPQLTGFYEFTSGLDSHTRGEMVGQHDALRSVHNSFARSTAFSFEDRTAKEDDDVFHFVGFIFKDGAIWELDGLQPGPIHSTEATAADWKQKLADVVQQRIVQLSNLDTKGEGQGISFSLMAVVADRIPQLELEIAMQLSGGADCTFLQHQLEDLKTRREKGRVENIRRRHNYIPCIVALLRALAEKGKLEPAIEAAKARTAERKAAKKQRAAKGAN